MALRPKVRHRTSWFVLIAFFLATLAPSLGMAWGGNAATQVVWGQFCSTDGPALVAIDVGDDDTAAATDDTYGSHTGHCLLCFHPSTTPQNPSVTPVGVGVSVLRVTAETEAQGGYFRAWNTPLPRAPPLIT